MATRLYFHNATNALSGVFPLAKQSALTQSYATFAGVNIKTMDTTIGTAQASLAASSLAQTTAQSGLYGWFCSPAFAVNQNVGGGGQTLTLNIANQESNLFMNIGVTLSAMIYVWRPSTGAIVGTVCANLALTGVIEPGGTNERTNIGTTTATSTVAALAGDCLLCEVWQTHTQNTATAYTGTLYYDGTTVNTSNNTVVTNHASFLDFSADSMNFGSGPVVGVLSATTEDLIFSSMGYIYDPVLAAASRWDEGVWDVSVWDGTVVGGLSVTIDDVTLAAQASTVVQGGLAITLDNVSLTAAGGPVVTGTMSATVADVALSAIGQTVVAGAMSVTLDDVTLSALGQTVVAGTMSVTLDDVGLSAAGTVTAGASADGSLSITLDDVALSALGSTIVAGAMSITLADVSLSALGTIDVAGQMSITLDNVTLAALGSTIVEGALNATLEDVSLSAIGVVAGGNVNGTLSILLDDVSLSALGQVVSNFPPGGSGGGGGGGRISDKSSNRDLKKLFNIQSEAPPEQAISAPKPSMSPELLEDLTFIFMLSEL